MAKKKEPKQEEATVLTGLPNDIDNSLVVQKSRPLFALWQSSLTLSHFKILDVYLARIDSHKPENRTVRFAYGEFERLLGVAQIKKSDLLTRLRGLQTTVDIAPSDNSKAADSIVLFERAKAEQDENGAWQVDMTCSASAMKYIFNADKLGYFRYKLRSITSLTSRYSYIMFTYLEVNRGYRNEWVVALDELRKRLNCDDDPTYKQFKRFNDLILKKCHKDLHEKTECRFSYTTVKNGKVVVAIKFKLEPLAEAVTISATEPREGEFEDCTALTQAEIDAEKDSHYATEHLAFLANACDYEFPNDVIVEFNDIVYPMFPHSELAQHDHISAKYHAMKARDAELRRKGQPPIRSRAAYLKKLLQQE